MHGRHVTCPPRTLAVGVTRMVRAASISLCRGGGEQEKCSCGTQRVRLSRLRQHTHGAAERRCGRCPPYTDVGRASGTQRVHPSRLRCAVASIPMVLPRNALPSPVQGWAHGIARGTQCDHSSRLRRAIGSTHMVLPSGAVLPSAGEEEGPPQIEMKRVAGLDVNGKYRHCSVCHVVGHTTRKITCPVRARFRSKA